MAPPSRPARPLLEREAELAALEALLAAARAGDGHLVVVEAPAGMGKTRLLGEARSLAGQFEVLSARAGELEGDFAYGVVRQLFEPALATAPAEVSRELLAGAAELAAPLLVHGGDAPAAGTSSPFSILHGLYWLAANFALRRCTMLVVDDLHWADEPSLRWLDYLARRLEGLPLLVLAATRPAEQAGSPQLVDEILSDPGATVIRPGPLGDSSAASLARVLFELEPDAEFTEALRTASGGNPLYLTALLDAVAEGGIEPTAAQASHVLRLGPRAAARGIALRTSRLPAPAATLLEVAAVLGDGGQLDHAATIAGIDAETASRGVSSLICSDLLRQANPIEFFHPIVRSAVYENIGAGDRSVAHRRAAELLLAAGARPERAAAHLLHTLPAGDAFVTTTLRQAAARLLEHGAPETAISHLRRALDEPAADQAGAVLWELGSAEQLVGGPDAADSLARALELTDDPGRRAAIALQYSRTLWLSGRFEEAIDVVQQATDDAGPVAAPLREELHAGLIGASWGYARFYPLAVERLSRVHEDELVGGIGSDQLLALLAEYEMRRGVDRPRAATLAEQSLASGTVVRLRDFALYSATAVLLAAGEIERVAAVVDPALTEARRKGDLVGACRLINLRSLVELHRGNLRAAEHDVAEAVELAALLGVDSVRWLAGGREAWVGLELGNAEPARKLLAAFEPGHTEMTAAQSMFLLEIRGRLRLLERQPEDAVVDFRECGKAARSIGFENPACSAWRSEVALALLALGRRDEALVPAAEELELARAWGEPRAIGTSLRVLGLAEGGDVGERLLREAVAVLADSPSRLEHARALIDLGAALRRGNSRSEARKQLRVGLELAERCGAIALFDRANDELAATGAHRRTIMVSGVDALTASERRVAQLAAEGVSNKDIAQALFVTVKTVEMHLSRVYRKLAISSRAQLTGSLDESGTQAPATA